MQDNRPSPWVAATEEAVDARGRPYLACVPVLTQHLDPEIPARVAAAADDATIAAVRFDATVGARFGEDADHVAALLAHVDAASSSAIENVHAHPLDVARAHVQPRRVDASARLVAAHVHSTQAARTLLAGPEEASAHDLLSIHGRLLGDHAPHLVGAWRKSIVWIGGMYSSPHTATYVAPEAARVPALMDDLCAFIDRSDVPVLAHAAIAHAQYETIHPHGDGNGRSGRALVHGLLARGDVVTHTVLPYAAHLHRNVRDYYDALKSYRAGDLAPVIEMFAHAVHHGVRVGQRVIGEAEETLKDWRERLTARSDSVAWPALPWLLAQPVITIGRLVEQFGVTYPAAQRAVESLEAAGVIEPLNGQRRGRSWVAPDAVALRAIG